MLADQRSRAITSATDARQGTSAAQARRSNLKFPKRPDTFREF
jgi:hypothetical protein